MKSIWNKNAADDGKESFFQGLRRERLRLLVMAGIFAVVGCGAYGRLNIVDSGSLAHRLFYMVAPEQIKSGDYLVFRQEVPEFLKAGHKIKAKTDLLTKQVVCMPGETLTTEPGWRYFCNGRPVGQALETDSRGHVLPHFTYNGVIPVGSYFVEGANLRSFDSKYFGLVQKNEIFRKAYPLF